MVMYTDCLLKLWSLGIDSPVKSFKPLNLNLIQTGQLKGFLSTIIRAFEEILVYGGPNIYHEEVDLPYGAVGGVDRLDRVKP